MTNKIWIIIVILFLSHVISFNVYSQKKIDNNFPSNWLLEKYYKGLMEGKLPQTMQLEGALLKHIFFNLKNSEVMISSLWEAATVNYKITSKNEITINDTSFFPKKILLRISEENGKMILVTTDKGKSYKFISLPPKYDSRFGLEQYVNDLFFTGKYYINDSRDSIVTFTSDRKVQGLGSFDQYYLPVACADCSNKFNSITLRDSYKRKRPIRSLREAIDQDYIKVLHWKHEGNKIILFNTNELEKEVPDEILDKYLTLTKLK
jgi:hypothetical protein